MFCPQVCKEKTTRICYAISFRLPVDVGPSILGISFPPVEIVTEIERYPRYHLGAVRPTSRSPFANQL